MQIRRAFLLVVLWSFFLFVGSSCMGGGKYGLLGATCPPLVSGDPLQAQFSANARANAKIRAFVSASKSLVEASVQMEALAAEACRNMGRDLGVAESAMQPRGDEDGGAAKAACGALSAKIDSILRSGIQVRVQATPPQCQANVEAKARCEGSCDVQIDPGEIVAQCEPGKLSGHCQGRCIGRCEGTCQGQCSGQCSAYDAQGRCAGQCDGECNGGCTATCHARCEGQWQAPKCEGHVRPPSADAECNASCHAKAQFEASCTPAQVNVETNANVEMAARLVATLRTHLPQLLKAEIGLGKRIIADARVVVEVGAQLPKIVGDAGAQAVACIAAASSASVKASARINVSIQASASVSGKVGASSG
jgi:hypothetical protein